MKNCGRDKKNKQLCAFIRNRIVSWFVISFEILILRYTKLVTSRYNLIREQINEDFTYYG